MSHDDFAFEPVRGLPAHLPKGEQLLWQGSPAWKSLALRAYHVRKVALYFLALLCWNVTYGLARAHPTRDILVSSALLIVSGVLACGVLSALAYFSSRSTVYSITSRRVMLRHGIAVPMTMNIPFKLIDGAALKVFSNHTGDIALAVPKDQRVGYLITWPHLRPGYLTRPQPSLRALNDAEHAAEILGAALALDAGAPATLATPTAWPAGRVPDTRAPASPAGGRTLGPRPAAVA